MSRTNIAKLVVEAMKLAGVKRVFRRRRIRGGGEAGQRAG